MEGTFVERLSLDGEDHRRYNYGIYEENTNGKGNDTTTKN
jgi:hypothetical protein